MRPAPGSIGRQRKVKRCPFSFLALGPGASAVALNDAANVRQADACAFELLIRMEPLEYAEKPLSVVRVEANAIVTHLENDFVVLDDGADFNFGRVARACVLHGIAQEINPDLPQEISVARNLGQ